VRRPAAHPLVLLLLAALGPAVALRLRRPEAIGSTVDLLLALGVAAFVVVCEVLRRANDA
jgi:hypothetical protein